MAEIGIHVPNALRVAVVDLRGLSLTQRYGDPESEFLPAGEYRRVLDALVVGGWSWVHPANLPVGMAFGVRLGA